MPPSYVGNNTNAASGIVGFSSGIAQRQVGTRGGSGDAAGVSGQGQAQDRPPSASGKKSGGANKNEISDSVRRSEDSVPRSTSPVSPPPAQQPQGRQPSSRTHNRTTSRSEKENQHIASDHDLDNNITTTPTTAAPVLVPTGLGPKPAALSSDTHLSAHEPRAFPGLVHVRERRRSMSLRQSGSSQEKEVEKLGRSVESVREEGEGEEEDGEGETEDDSVVSSGIGEE